ncbi:MAG: selenocysteine-specific translation elongation factor [Chloroflexi bacterium]|nr:selenocysteine-specific translation elongation factor [Chloroflexota bacterium]
MSTYVIGTAGHVDHGKSTLVKALTGIDPDRLKEEKEREMTIDLGFAWLTLPGGTQVSVIDVPGHEDFIKNMLAGVGGIDAAMVVVAADEGVMPQTREHVAILHLLGIQRGVVAVTKSDLVEDPEWLDLVKADIQELLKETTLAHVEVVPVSARTGKGIPELLETLEKLLLETPSRRDINLPRLGIDRVFTLSGFGTVVTGTLLDGTFHQGDEVEILPQGLRARIRGLQTHKNRLETVHPGSRVAMNLTNVGIEDLHRGDVVTQPGQMRISQMLDARLEYLAEAERPLRHNQGVEFFTGAAQILGRVRLIGTREVQPGEQAWVQLVLEGPAVVSRGDHFILRQPSPSQTLAGGVVVDPHPTRRYRRFRPEVIARLETLAHGTPAELLLQALERQQPVKAGLTLQELAKASQLPEAVIAETVSQMVSQGMLLVMGSDSPETPTTLSFHGSASYLTTNAAWHHLAQQITQYVTEFHRQYPLRTGMSREELKSRLHLDARVFAAVLAHGIKTGILVEENSTVRLPDHRVVFNAGQQAAVDRVLRQFNKSPQTPPSAAEVESELGTEVLGALIDQGTLVRISPEVLFLKEMYDIMLQQIIAALQQRGKLTAAEVRDMFGSSRKYAVALLEYLDQQRITQRVGDARILRKYPA